MAGINDAIGHYENARMYTEAGVIVNRADNLVHLYQYTPVTVAVATPVVLDVRGMRAMMCFLQGGTATYTPCDASGVQIPGSAALSFTNATAVVVNWPFYKVTATTAAAVVCANY